jgi:mono/diheme cytochrome c family protein
MPGFGAVLSDSQIRDVLAYIKSRWSPRSRDAQRKIDEERRR